MYRRMLFLALLLPLALHAGEEMSPFVQATGARTFEFPRDHGSHPAFKTEWWYFTGALKTKDGEDLGFEATWFRRALKPASEAPPRASKLAAREVIAFHGALSDVAKKAFLHEKSACRAAANWAGADEKDLRVFLLNNTLERDDEGAWRLRYTVKGRRVELKLTPQAEPLLHGDVPGLSPKGPKPGQASYYVSVPRLKAEGTVTREPGAAGEAVTGEVWFDHEFFSDSMPDDLAGWDWFSVALDDGTDLMLYALRAKDGSIGAVSAGTLRRKGQAAVHLAREDFKIEVQAHWTSPHTKAEYPAQWTIAIPKHGVTLNVKPLLADQELQSGDGEGVSYWEGLCRYEGAVIGAPVTGNGYVELVGYAGAFGGKL